MIIGRSVKLYSIVYQFLFLLDRRKSYYYAQYINPSSNAHHVKKHVLTTKQPHTLRNEKWDAKSSLSEEDPYFGIIPLPDFDWQTAAPLKLRPFKPKYHLTMGKISSLLDFVNILTALGLTNSTISELVEIDRTYLTRVTLRKQIMKDHHEIVLQADRSIKPAVDELYTWLVSTYLPSRFPTMFTITPTGLLNDVTSESIPLTPPSDPLQALEILGGNIDDDFLLLLPSNDGDGYMLKGFITCFPSGFNTKEKFGLKLRDIHKPVPGYKEKLEKSMDRFFEKIEVGKIVLRVNVSWI
jgi:hypothetical protein